MSFLSAYSSDYQEDPAVVGNYPVNSTAAESSGSWGGWNDVLKGAFTYGVSRYIDSETRQEVPQGYVPGMYGTGQIPIASTGATVVSNKAMLFGGLVLVGALAYLLLKR